MPAELRGRLQDLVARHSAAAAYAPDGMYGDRESEADRSMRIVYSDKAREYRTHPLIQQHPENGRDTIIGCVGYIVGFEGVDDDEAIGLLTELYEWQTREAFQYTHEWEKDMVVIWDNRSVLHRAYGGYEGHDRILHRITIGADPAKFLDHHATGAGSDRLAG